MATVTEGEPKIEIGRVVQRGFEVLGRQFAPFLALALLLSGIPSALMNWFILDAAANANPAALFGSPLYWGAWAFTMLGGYLLQAVIARSAILQLNGMPAQIGPSLANAFRLILPMIGLTVCSGFVIGFGLLLLIVPGVIAYLILIVSVPALVEEGGVFHSMQRSRELTKGSRGRIFLLLIMFVIIYLIVLGLGGALTAVLFLEMLLLQAMLQGLMTALTTLLMSAMLAALYFELRTVKEGATVEGLVEVFA